MASRPTAIPTVYKGVQFRSRLEAKWAYFFDALGWQWEYEPIDLDYYIPDFLLLGDIPCLVEVKPYSLLAEFEPLAANLPEAGYDYLIVGINPFLTLVNNSGPAFGYTCQGDGVGGRWWGGASLSHCWKCDSYYFVHESGGWFALGVANGCPECRKPGMSHESEARARGFWAQAQNITQWAA